MPLSPRIRTMLVLALALWGAAVGVEHGELRQDSERNAE